MSVVPTAVLLDRDGTLNVKAPEGEYVTDPSGLRLLAGAAAAVRRLNHAGVPVAFVTNQRGVARGMMTSGDLDAVHDRLTTLLAAEGAHLDAVLFCPYERGVCDCRKPAPGLLLQAARQLKVEDLSAAVMIGDAESDVGAGSVAGARTIPLARSRPRHTEADACARDLASAVETLLPAR